MRPHWLRGWSWWGDARSPYEGYDPRPLWQRVALFIGIRKDF